ncbi:DUF2911 domain-containing protein [Jejuia pallidilutea]|jgi:hypothetical protein|uniref:DUF2911 family protein n=1 Tax=Jejuia pallidilutea TaxID=504487 RepID=A0A090WV37_9FLAO|nr:DUF2911 domain-containing protein [Jejuia pallidilutea]PQV47383.1 Protein of unknown function (DUF2911) [Jejuia pallidilutea]GAL67463.1 hypothetical protein JCM19301_436 [Jejuia pallidilutea]GAL71262.1 hypothetical protein JCM19302_939 [Jejuia pallidilutea]GAL88757.1 hypothetical protein JCM19538_1192 [Jejuia pallidilutea]
MNTFLKRIIFILLLAASVIFVYSYLNDGLQKRKSPKKNVAFKVDDLKLNVFYNRPSKRGREVFGALVPYGDVWRTGANEATTFETNKSLKIGNDSLQPGKYTLWTIPNDTAWTVIFNSKQYPWGVDHKTLEPLREPEFDVVNYSAPVEKLNTEVEQFTIAFDNSTDNLFMTMAWDNIRVKVPLK